MGLHAPVYLIHVITQDFFILRRVITFRTLMRTVFSDLENNRDHLQLSERCSVMFTLRDHHQHTIRYIKQNSNKELFYFFQGYFIYYLWQRMIDTYMYVFSQHEQHIWWNSTMKTYIIHMHVIILFITYTQLLVKQTLTDEASSPWITHRQILGQARPTLWGFKSLWTSLILSSKRCSLSVA